MVQCNYSTMHLACFGGVAPSIVTSKVALLAAQTHDLADSTESNTFNQLV